jgi:hypothetical protein
MSMRSPLWPFAAALLLAQAAPASADVFTVGIGPDCTHAGIQDAIDAAEANGPGADTIRIASNQAYEEVRLEIHDQSLTLAGGFANCSAVVVSEPPTVLSGAGNDGGPVLEIVAVGGTGPQTVHLQNLVLADADVGPGDGAGLRVRGWVFVYASGLSLRNGRAGQGGALHATGEEPDKPAHVQLSGMAGWPSRLEENQAQFGGGVFCDDHARVFLSPGTRVAANFAQFGGGAFARGSCELYVYAGGESGGLGFGVRDNESGVDGGGVHAEDGAQVSTARFFAAVAPPEVSGNRAGRDGGGIFLRDAGSFLLGYNLYLRGNEAGTTEDGRGGGLFVGSQAAALLTEDNESVICGWPEPCVDISGNVAGTSGFGGSGGGVHVDGGTVSLGFARLHANAADDGAAAVVNGATRQLNLRSAIVSGHASTGDALVARNGATLNLLGVTVANDASAGAILRAESDAAINLRASILHSPGSDVLALTAPATVGAECVLSHTDFLPSGDVRVGNPDFLDAAGGDFRLGAGSDAIDACGASQFLPGETDFAEQPRGVDLPDVPNLGGAYDLGAFERQLPLPEAIFRSGFED